MIALSAITLFFTQIGVPEFSRAGVDEDITVIKKDLSEVKKKLEEIKGLLQSRPQPRLPSPTSMPVSAGIDDDPFLGDFKAPITLIEFSDYQCPFCGRFFQNTLPLLKKEYIETGTLKYVFRDFPLPFHKEAQKAAEAAQCAGDQGRYWEMHDLIFQNQKAMKVEDLKGHAESLGLNIGDFNRCLDGGKYTEEIKKDRADGQKAGVQGTPGFILGRSTEDGKIKGRFIRGAQPYQSFKKEIESLLEKS